MLFSQEQILTAIEPIARNMQELGSNAMKVTFRDKDDKALVTIVVARDDKAALVDKAMDLVDAAYDVGGDAERNKGKTQPVEETDEDEDLFDDDLDDDDDDDDWDDDLDFVDDDEDEAF